MTVVLRVTLLTFLYQISILQSVSLKSIIYFKILIQMLSRKLQMNFLNI